MGNMGSAHPLVEVNVSFKFEGNPSISKGVIERHELGDGRTDRPTDATKRIQYSPPPTHILYIFIPPHTFYGGGIKMITRNLSTQKQYSNKTPFNNHIERKQQNVTIWDKVKIQNSNQSHGLIDNSHKPASMSF